ncbi:LacI family DNA-binding transcriptional regulator [Lichenicoccus roseus]|nr:LacI family DNA-binding transcriptional regulator [Lichenicoccus roseus]
MSIPTGNRPNRQPRVTILDVAAKAGVHVSTASRALNPKAEHRISGKMVRKIELIAEQLGYSPNPLATSLRTQRTGTVGLVVPNLSDPLFAPIIAAAQERVAEDDFVTFVASSDYKPEKLLSIIEIMSRRHVAGLMVASFDIKDPAADLCLKLGIPTVAVLRDPRHAELSSVTMDDEKGVRALVEHVLDLGHRRIAYITAPLAASTAHNRLAGFMAGTKLAKAAHCQFDVIEADAYHVEEGERIMKRLIADGMRWTAFLCFNDLLAVGALVALKAAGIACPDEISVTGVNDLPFMGLLSPPLTSLHNAGRKIGSQGAELLLDLIENGHAPTRHVLFSSHVVVRGSTGPAPSRPVQDRDRSAKAARRQPAVRARPRPP